MFLIYEKNLISLGTLDKQGYTFSGGDGQVKVLKGAMTVMKGKRSIAFTY